MISYNVLQNCTFHSAAVWHMLLRSFFPFPVPLQDFQSDSCPPEHASCVINTIIIRIRQVLLPMHVFRHDQTPIFSNGVLPEVDTSVPILYSSNVSSVFIAMIRWIGTAVCSVSRSSSAENSFPGWYAGMITSTFIFSMLSPFASFFAAGFLYECMVTEEGNFFNEKFPSSIIVIYDCT